MHLFSFIIFDDFIFGVLGLRNDKSNDNSDTEGLMNLLDNL